VGVRVIHGEIIQRHTFPVISPIVIPILLLLLQCSLLPGGIILQGVLLLQGYIERFCVPLLLGANWGYWPSDSVFDQGGGVHHKLLMFLDLDGFFLLATGICTRYKEPRFYVSFEGREQSK
jgi:hypothetical protein